ncbi:hypothetical protein [Micromonospora echinaurantiaca]|uniref:hypothetical protein n=1 Tax=Micromonospora echinaurantiaca TaxID=47857 RepID=UPI00155FBB7D|nr:hypothetical protein [Micromonospora echinaurantiaca]
MTTSGAGVAPVVPSGDGVASSGDAGGLPVGLGGTVVLVSGEGDGDGEVPPPGEPVGDGDGDGVGRGGGAVVPPEGRGRAGGGVRAGAGSAANPAGPGGRPAGRHGAVFAGPSDGVPGGVAAGWLVTGSGITTGPTDGVGMNGVLVSGSAVLPTVADPVLIAARIGIDAVPASRATVNR